MAVTVLARSTLVIALCGLACSPQPPVRQRPPVVDTARIDAIVEASQRELHLPAVSLAIMQGHSVVLARGYGLADREASTPASAETIYPVGSISKQFTAAAVMKLVESGRIDLDTPVTSYVPEYRPTSGTSPTIRQLLQQTAGLLAWDDLPEGRAFLAQAPGAEALDLDRIVRLLGPVPPLFAPGTWWSYSNSNYSLLAKAIENVTGAPYERHIDRALIEPLALRSTGECASARIEHASNHAMGYEWVDGAYALRPMTAAKGRAFAGAGGLCSTASDLAHWTRALVDHEVVGAPSFRQMTTAAQVTSGFTAPYGFGLSLVPLLDRPAIWHMGVMAGFVTVVAYVPEADLILVAIANSRHTWLQSLVKKIARHMLSVPERSLADLPIPPAERARSIGDYDDSMFRFRVLQRGDQLFVEVPALGPPVRLLYQGDHAFATPEPQAFRFRFEPAEGPVTRVDWEWGELRAFARRR
jgi:D-alanyl-D-alanine carboxypeptidase